MKVHYTGRKAEISDAQKRKLDRKFRKCQKILGGKHSPEAHVVVNRQRYRFDAEITLRALNHTFVVSGVHVDCFHALLTALDRLEKQIVRSKHKLIDGHRPERQRGQFSPVTQAALTELMRKAADENSGAAAGSPAHIVRSNRVAPKPMTVEEALLQIDELGSDHVTYRDAESGELRVLLRRRDGGLELIEAG